jgi:HSP20 family protein
MADSSNNNSKTKDQSAIKSTTSFNLDASINKLRESAPKLSLPTNLFEPWWQTMFHDPDASWILRNLDIMSSDFAKPWAFPVGFGDYIPRVDVMEQADDLKVCAEVPGIDEKDIDVAVTDSSLTIKGKKENELPKDTEKMFQSIERSYGSFARTIILPSKVDVNKVHATMNNGVLTITLPKKTGSEQPEGKKVTITRL